MLSQIRKIIKNKHLWICVAIFLGVSAICGLEAFLIIKNTPSAKMTGASGDARAQWYAVNKFVGYETKADPQKIHDGANPAGQNTFINDGDRISMRDFGYEIFPGESSRISSPTSTTGLHTFRKRSGENIMLHGYDDELEYYSSKVGRWERLKNGYTIGAEFGFADHNTNTDQTSYVYFGNAVQNYSQWTGNIAVLTSAVTSTATTLLVDDTTLFPTSGTVIVCGNPLAYTGKSSTSFTIAAATTTCASGRGVAQIPTEYSAAPKGNILIVMNTRMFMAGVTSSTQALFYSEIADATDFTFSTVTTTHVATEGGLINMPEGGGAITGMAADEGYLYVFKRNIVNSVTFSTDGNDLPTIKPIKPYDNKSQTVGAVNQRSIFAGGNGIFFITPNNEIMNLSRIESIDYPQVTPISDIISNTVNDMVFASSTGVWYKNKAYFSAKQDSDSTTNDTLLIWDGATKSWMSPVIGLNVNEFTIFKTGDDENLYFGDSTSPNVFKINSSAVDDLYGITANWRSREETFGAPHLLKSIDNFYVEGYIDDTTILNVSLLCNEDGYTQKYTQSFTGNESSDKYRFVAAAFNLFGLNEFGYERFGGNADYTGKRKFRFYLAQGLKRVPCYSWQVEFASDTTTANQRWDVTAYGFHYMFEPQDTDSHLYKSF